MQKQRKETGMSATVISVWILQHFLEYAICIIGLQWKSSIILAVVSEEPELDALQATSRGKNIIYFTHFQFNGV
jgi:hypothetical protein